VTLRFYMDHHIPEAVTAGLRRLGVDCATALEDGRSREAGSNLMMRALELDRIVFSMDEDFLTIASEWLRASRNFAGVDYAHQLQITIGQAIRDLHLMSEVLETSDTRNVIERLPL
jgi:hypothetical protein